MLRLVPLSLEINLVQSLRAPARSLHQLLQLVLDLLALERLESVQLLLAPQLLLLLALLGGVAGACAGRDSGGGLADRVGTDGTGVGDDVGAAAVQNGPRGELKAVQASAGG